MNVGKPSTRIIAFSSMHEFIQERNAINVLLPKQTGFLTCISWWIFYLMRSQFRTFWGFNADSALLNGENVQFMLWNMIYIGGLAQSPLFSLHKFQWDYIILFLLCFCTFWWRLTLWWIFTPIRWGIAVTLESMKTPTAFCCPFGQLGNTLWRISRKSCQRYWAKSRKGVMVISLCGATFLNSILQALFIYF